VKKKEKGKKRGTEFRGEEKGRKKVSPIFLKKEKKKGIILCKYVARGRKKKDMNIGGGGKKKRGKGYLRKNLCSQKKKREGGKGEHKKRIRIRKKGGKGGATPLYFV